MLAAAFRVLYTDPMTRRKKTDPAQGILLPDAAASFRCSGRETAATMIAGLAPSSRVIGLTMGQFSLLDLLRAILDKTGPAHVVLSTWTVGIRDAENAAWLLESGQMLSFQLLTDASFARRQPDYCRAVRTLFGDESIRATNVHAKVALVSNDDWHIAVRSSMNLNKNPRFEQFDLDTDPAIWRFFADAFARITAPLPVGPVVDAADNETSFHALLDGREREAQHVRREGEDAWIGKHIGKARAFCGLPD